MKFIWTTGETANFGKIADYSLSGQAIELPVSASIVGLRSSQRRPDAILLTAGDIRQLVNERKPEQLVSYLIHRLAALA